MQTPFFVSLYRSIGRKDNYVLYSKVAVYNRYISVSLRFDSNKKNQNGGLTMKTKYFEYNRNGRSEKYSEFTEEEYLKAKEDENRWFISFGDSVLECEESQYTDHFSKKDHDEYTQKDKNWKKVIPVSLEQYTYGGNSEQKILKDSTVVPLEERVLEQLSLEHDLEKLRRAMEKLKPYEQKIIYQIFWKRKSQSKLAREYGISQQTMNEKCNRILVKMLKIMKNEK